MRTCSPPVIGIGVTETTGLGVGVLLGGGRETVGYGVGVDVGS